MLLRYLVLFGGIVLMITGCNSLISQNFGTHRLRTRDLARVPGEGLGDADFVELANAVISTPAQTSPAGQAWQKDHVYRPLLTPAQQAEWQAGATVRSNVIGWFKTTDPACSTAAGCPPPATGQTRGLLNAPDANRQPDHGAWRAERIEVPEQPLYLQLGEQPMAWYWNLVLIVLGLSLALLPEYRRHSQRTKRELE